MKKTTKPIRLYLRLFTAFIGKFKLILLLGVLFGIIIFAGFTYILPHLQTDSQKIGVVGEYTTTNLPDKIALLVSSGLTRIDKDGHPLQGIANKWEVEDGGKTWTFHINPSLRWQDNTKITAKDINYNFSDALVSKPNDSTVVFKLKTPLSDFPVIVSKPIFKKGLLGTLDWKVSSLTLAGTYIETLTIRNANKEIIFKFYPTQERAKLAYQLGQVNSLEDLVDPKPFDRWIGTQVTKFVNKNQYVAVFFNTSNGILADKDIRQALSYAIDKKTLSEDRALGPISPNSWGYNASIKSYDFDIKHAQELIQGSKISPDDKKNPKIKLTTVPNLLPVAEQISKNWKDAGVSTTLQVTSFIPDDFEAFLAVYDIPTDPDQYSTWHSTQLAGNITRYKNARIDKLLEDGRLETDELKRKAIYFDFQKYLLEDAPAAFLYYPSYYNIQRK